MRRGGGGRHARVGVTVAGFFNAPSVDEVDVSGYAGQAGDPIVVRASDVFDVVGSVLA